MAYLLGLCALVFNPLGYNVYELPKLWLVSLLVAIVALSSAVDAWKNDRFHLPLGGVVGMLLSAWIVSLVLSTVFAEAPWQSLFGDGNRLGGLLAQLVYVLVFLLALVGLASQTARRKFFRVSLLLSIPVAVYALLQAQGVDIYFPSSVQDFLGRVFATMGHPTALGQYLLFPLWISLVGWFQDEKRSRWWLVLAGVFFVCLVLTGNRASLLGVVGMVGLVGLGRFHLTPASHAPRLSWRAGVWGPELRAGGPDNSPARLGAGCPLLEREGYWGGTGGLRGIVLVGLLGLVGVVAGSVWWVNPSLRSLLHRWEVWKASLTLLGPAGLFGYGLDGFTQAFEGVIPARMYEYEYLYIVVDKAHNVFLDLWVTQGLVGVVLLISVFSVLVYHLWKKPLRSWSSELWMSVLTLGSLFISLQFGFLSVVHWVMVMMLLAVILHELELVQMKVVPVRNLETLGVCALVMLGVVLNYHFSRVLWADSVFAGGRLALEQGRVVEAVSLEEQALTINPYQAYITIALAELGLGLGEELGNPAFFQSSEELFESAAGFQGKGFRYYYEMGLLRSSEGRGDEAEIFFQQASKVAPNKPVLYESWAEGRFERGNFGGARELLGVYFQLLPEVTRRIGGVKHLSEEDRERLRLLLKNSAYYEMRALWLQLEKASG